MSKLLWHSTFIIVLSFLLLHAAANVPLPPPIHCNSTGCTVDNYQGLWLDRKPCRASAALYPSSEAELFQAVARASKSGTKIRVVSRGSHSIPKLVCPGGHDGILVSTREYNSLIHVNLTSKTVTAHAGVMLEDLLQTVAQHGLALPASPYWHGVSVAGMISTGAHGSSMWGKGSGVHDHVVGMRIIVPTCEEEGFAKVVELVEGDADLDAARLSLGVLGAISTVTFQLEPMFKRSVTLELRGDEELEHAALELAKAHEFSQLSWYPASGKMLVKVDDRVAVDTPGDGAYKLLLLDKMDVGLLESMRTEWEASEELQDMEAICEQEPRWMILRLNSGDGLVNDGTGSFVGYPVIGFHHKIQACGGCERDDPSLVITPTGIQDLNPSPHEPPPLDGDGMVEELQVPYLVAHKKLGTCFWNPLIKGFLYFDTSISIPVSKFSDALLDIKRLRDTFPQAMCNLAFLGGIWIRFVTASKAYLGEPTDAVVFEMFYYRSKEPVTPRFRQDLFEEIEQILVFKYGGKPHWGKNRDLAFEAMHQRTSAMEKFVEVRQRFDPQGLFSNEWTDAILGIKSSSRDVQTFQKYCALEGLCICKEDSHCHPTKGILCRPGHVYKEARVCRFEKQELAT
ncbi:hypothetical protein L7F22_006966 [Adiantum nelumboides]|nr:hypothetical protein [Adiantum nelumboides]